MMSLVATIKDTFTKDKAIVSTAEVNPRVTKLKKLAKVPSWSKDMSLETYGKQIST